MKVNNLFYLVMTSVIAALLLGILIQNQILIGKISNLNSVSQTSKNSFTKSVSPLSKTAFQGKLKEPNTNKPVRIIKKGWLLWQVKSFTKNGKPSWSILSALSKGNGIALTPY